MLTLNIYFEDLNTETQNEIYQILRKKLGEEINEAKESCPDVDPETIEAEVIEDYINTHNFANEFTI